MPAPVFKTGMLLQTIIGLSLGIVFTYIVGFLEVADYLVDQWSIWIIELPFIVLIAVFVNRIGWRRFIYYGIFGVLSSWSLTFGEGSIAPLVYAKVSLTGLILGEISWFGLSSKKRLLAATLPSLVFAFGFGLPVIFKGFPPEIIDRFREESLEMYKMFMSPDKALNAADNARMMFETLVKTGFAVFAISAFVYAWFSYQALQLIAGKFNVTIRKIFPFRDLKIPFHLIWLFLATFGLLLSEFEPLLTLALNIFVILAFLYFIQGLAIIMFHMQRMKLGRFPRIIFWLMFFFTIVFSGFVLIFIGLIENWFSLRPKMNEDSINITM